MVSPTLNDDYSVAWHHESKEKLTPSDSAPQVTDKWTLLGDGVQLSNPALNDDYSVAWHHEKGNQALKSVDEHNTEVRKRRQEREEAARKTGVACPKCGKELYWPWNPFSISFNAGYYAVDSTRTRLAHCQTCGISVQLEI